MPVTNEVYQEEDSTFTHDGVEYDLNGLLKLTRHYPVRQIAVADLSWNLVYVSDSDENRINTADLKAPLLIVKDPRFNPPTGNVVIDGTHRLIKATREKKSTVPARAVTMTQLKRFRIAKVATEELPSYMRW